MVKKAKMETSRIMKAMEERIADCLFKRMFEDSDDAAESPEDPRRSRRRRQRSEDTPMYRQSSEVEPARGSRGQESSNNKKGRRSRREDSRNKYGSARVSNRREHVSGTHTSRGEYEKGGKKGGESRGRYRVERVEREARGSRDAPSRFRQDNTWFHEDAKRSNWGGESSRRGRVDSRSPAGVRRARGPLSRSGFETSPPAKRMREKYEGRPERKDEAEDASRSAFRDRFPGAGWWREGRFPPTPSGRKESRGGDPLTFPPADPPPRTRDSYDHQKKYCVKREEKVQFFQTILGKIQIQTLAMVDRLTKTKTLAGFERT